MKNGLCKKLLKIAGVACIVGGVVKVASDLINENIDNFEDELNEDDLVSEIEKELDEEFEKEFDNEGDRTYITINKNQSEKNNEEVKEEIDKESNKETIEKSNNFHKTIHNDFFKCDILEEYNSFVIDFEQSQGEYLNLVKKDVFNVVGDFNVELLKETFKKQYLDIKRIMEAEILGMPMISTLPLDYYLAEIDRLSNSNDLKEKVFGLLSYWTVIDTSLGQGILV